MYDQNHVDKLYYISRMMWIIGQDHKRLDMCDYFLPCFKGTVLDVFKIDRNSYNGYMKVFEAFEKGLFTKDKESYYFEGYKNRTFEKSEIENNFDRTILWGHLADEAIRQEYIGKNITKRSYGSEFEYLLPTTEHL